MARRLLLVLWPLVLVFLPVWVGNLFLLSMSSRTDLLWNPVSIALAWPGSLSELFAYSAAFGAGAVFTLALCLFWYVRWPSLFYAVLLFFAAAMASPAWKVIATMWYAMGA